MMPRYSLAVGVAVPVTFVLLFLMQLMLASGDATLNERHPRALLDFVRVEPKPPIETRRDRPLKPPEPQPMPESSISIVANAITVGRPRLTGPTAPPFAVGFLGASAHELATDGEYLPMTKVQPVYPLRARRQGLEGYAVVEFNVTQEGETRDVRVVESSHRVFEGPCAEAAARFKYRPRVVGGEAVEVAGVRNRCSFELTD